MLTNNYKIAANYCMWWNNGRSKTSPDVIDINGTAVTGFYTTEMSSWDYEYGKHSFEDITKKQCSSIFVGTGDKEESPEDFALESIIPDSDLTVNNTNVVCSEDKVLFTKTYTYIGTNNITINEVAYYKSISQGSNVYSVVCLARQKIEPLTVSNGDVFTVTMVIG